MSDFGTMSEVLSGVNGDTVLDWGYEGPVGDLFDPRWIEVEVDPKTYEEGDHTFMQRSDVHVTILHKSMVHVKGTCLPMTNELTPDEAQAVLSALDGFEPDTASYDPEDTDPMGWSPEEVALLDTAYEKISRMVNR